MAGKGSKRRPAAISEEQLAANWEAVFGRKESNGVNTANIKKLKRLFSDPSIGRVLTESYSDDNTTWKIPTIDEILGQHERDLGR